MSSQNRKSREMERAGCHQNLLSTIDTLVPMCEGGEMVVPRNVAKLGYLNVSSIHIHDPVSAVLQFPCRYSSPSQASERGREGNNPGERRLFLSRRRKSYDSHAGLAGLTLPNVS